MTHLDQGPSIRRRQAQEFEQAAQMKSEGFIGELWGFLHANKKWWLLPIVLVLVLVGALIVLSSTALAPFIYTIF